MTQIDISGAIDWMRAQRREHLAATVTYRRGATSNPQVKATQAATVAIEENGEVINDAAAVDWLIDRADLTLGGLAVEPQPGDQIQRVYSHGSERFEVVAEAAGEPGWRWHGREAKTFRIHTVRI